MTKFEEQVKKEFWVDIDYIKAILKELEKNSVEDITLTEQFNKWFVAWLTEWANQIEKYFSENMPERITDFSEVDWNVISDIVVTDKVVDK